MESLIYAAILLAVFFLLTWRFAVRIGNYSIVDVAWSLSFAPVASLHAIFGEGWPFRRAAVALLISLWSLRLGVYLWGRVARHHPAEDPRYAILRERWRHHRERNFLIFFLAQGLLVWLLMLPVWLIAGNRDAGFAPLEIFGICLWTLALAGEAIADRQLSLFKRRNADPLAVCDTGLWRYSRHPNYFFQSLLWWSLFLMAIPAPWGWFSILAPAAMLFFLLKVTGIPLTEELALRRKGDAYRRYRESTSRFLPLPPRRTCDPETK